MVSKFDRIQRLLKIRELSDYNNQNRPLTQRELEHALTFLLSSNVITSSQFVEFKNKALPFTKG